MTPSQRRRSIDSSSSSSESSPSPHNPSHSEKQAADPRLEGEKATGAGSSSGDAQTKTSSTRGDHEPPPSYTASASASASAALLQQIPPSGYRIPLSSLLGTPFPGVERTRAAPFTDADGKSPIFIGSALMQYSVHPCKIAPNQPRPCYVSYGGAEIVHDGRYDLLPFVPEHMEFVLTSSGLIPPGRRPVKGGFEHDGKELYHAVAVIEGIKVPGKTGSHLNGCRIPYNGEEHIVHDNYEILWGRPTLNL
ncbi:hypothetical protein BC827DRAFT_1261012 [Russula dissimulans]|nr:hypothetical protein BC827DRAFT_1261012 [Russula dissimulans]